MGRFTETERKYEAAGSDQPPVPDLAGLAPHTRELPPVELDAVYYDTERLDLAAHRVTLRRRTGGEDAGWHLKLPAQGPDSRTEVHAPLEEDQGRGKGAGGGKRRAGGEGKQRAEGAAGRGDAYEPPAVLREETAALTRGRALVPVVRLRTTRRRTLLLDDANKTLAEIAYDEVRATPEAGLAATGSPAATGTGAPGEREREAVPGGHSHWAEIEVELADGEPELLDRVEERLRAAGIRRSAAPSKLSRALGGRRPAPVPEPPAAGPESTAGEAATAYLGAQRAAVLALDPAVRRAEPDAVHRMRVATRRARSALKSFGRELAREATDPLGAELKWLAAVLGGERDREVLAERLARRVADLDPAFVGPELLARLGLPPAGTTARPTAPSADRSSTLSSARSQAHAAVLATLDGARYFALLDALDALLAEPPYLPGAAAPARTAVAAAVRRDHRRLGAAVESALALPPGEERDIALHEARKDAKRARYSGEAAQPVLGEPAAAHTARMKAVQQLLGEHQDSVMCRTALAALRAEAEAAGEDPAPYEAIDRAERQAAARVEERLPGVWAAAGHSV